MMTLVDGVDTQLVVGDHEAFARSLDIITSEVSFDRDVSGVDVRGDDSGTGRFVVRPLPRDGACFKAGYSESGREQYIRRLAGRHATAVG